MKHIISLKTSGSTSLISTRFWQKQTKDEEVRLKALPLSIIESGFLHEALKTTICNADVCTRVTANKYELLCIMYNCWSHAVWLHIILILFLSFKLPLFFLPLSFGYSRLLDIVQMRPWRMIKPHGREVTWPTFSLNNVMKMKVNSMNASGLKYTKFCVCVCI